MASPTVYSWLDAGAPQITRGNKAQYQALFQACLIDGYGSKLPPVSGTNKWTIPFSDSTSFILKQGGTLARKTCIRLHSFGTSTGMYCDYVCAEDFSNATTPVNPWTGQLSGDRLGVGSATNAAYNIPWYIIATERSMFCQFGYNASSANITMFDSTGSDQMYNHAWFFGDYIAYDPAITRNQMVISINTASTSMTHYCEAILSNSTAYSKRTLAGNFGNVHGANPAEYLYLRPQSKSGYVGGNDITLPSYPDNLNGALYLDKLRLISARTIMGELPGLVYPLQAAPYPQYGQILEFDGVGDYLGEKLYCFSDYNRSQYFIRTGDWGVE